MYLFDLLFPPRDDEAVVRKISDDAFLALMRPRSVAATNPEAVALLPYSEQAVRSAIHEAKYHGTSHAVTLLASTLSEYLRDTDEGVRKPILVPIPLGSARARERGFNQAEEVVRRVLKNLGTDEITLDNDILIRTRETVSQVSLPKEKRRENMRGAFSASHPADPARTYILIDDVVTTGATLQAAIDALRGAGAIHVVPIALAH